MNDTRLFGAFFAGSSWDRWRAVLKAAFAEPMNSAEVALFREVAERDPPKQRVRELIVIAGRGAGKDSVASLVAAVASMRFDPHGKLRPGEKAYVLCLATDRAQAAIVLGYIRAYFEQIPALAAMVKFQNDYGIELTNSVSILVATNSFRSVRGRSLLCVIGDEVCFWRDDQYANPDTEVYAAVAPGLARIRDSMFIAISSAHKRSGLVYEAWRKHFGKSSDDVLVVVGTTLQFNCTFDKATIAKALAEDPALNAAEYLSQWRDDLAALMGRELIDAGVDRGVVVRPPQPDLNYIAFGDPSGGVGDSFTAAIAHAEGDTAVLDLLFERRPPFNPSEVVEEIAAVLESYRIGEITGDRYSAQWCVEAFAKVGITYLHSERDRSAVYLDALPLFSSGRVRLLDNSKLVSQFAALERRTFSTGKDRVDHGASGHDDLSNSAAGALVLAAARPTGVEVWQKLGGADDGPVIGQHRPGSAILYAANRGRGFA